MIPATVAGLDDPRAITVRATKFAYPVDMAPMWHPRLPELACVANAVSLAMPYVEPYVVASTRAVLPRLDDATRARAELYIRQEAHHHAEHRRLNNILRRNYRGVARIEGWIERTYSWLATSRSRTFNTGFAAGFETVAYCSARWVANRVDRLFTGADPIPTTLFLWHLAEEVEHKGVAFDVHRRSGGKRSTYVAGMLASFVLLAWFTLLGLVALLWKERRLFHPVAWVRLIGWSISFLFTALPTMAVSATAGHHPDDFADPGWFAWWLNRYDPATGTLPMWDQVD
jgi:uncharacterized protein